MAIYDYYCPLCPAKIVITQPIHASEVKPQCPNCKVDLLRYYTTPGVSFRGTGWGKD